MKIGRVKSNRPALDYPITPPNRRLWKHKLKNQSVEKTSHPARQNALNFSPNARRIAQELGVDWTGIPLPEGVRRITSEMIQDFARKNGMQGKNEMRVWSSP